MKLELSKDDKYGVLDHTRQFVIATFNNKWDANRYCKRYHIPKERIQKLIK